MLDRGFIARGAEAGGRNGEGGRETRGSNECAFDIMSSIRNSELIRTEIQVDNRKNREKPTA